MGKRIFKAEPAAGTARYKIQDLYKNPEAKFAVFCRSAQGLKAKFEATYTDSDVALEYARKYASEYASAGGSDFTYYVVEIKHRVGIENGKPVDTPMA
jgi:hypothetical protein